MNTAGWNVVLKKGHTIKMTSTECKNRQMMQSFEKTLDEISVPKEINANK
jgi:hypothetical protein